MTGMSKKYHHRRLTAEIKADLKLWLTFLESFNGVVHIPEQEWLSSETEKLFSAGGDEFGAACYFNGEWSFYQWPSSWVGTAVMKDMTFLEMVPVLLAVCIWGHKLANKRVVLWIDNRALVDVLNKQSCKSRRVMQLVRFFILQTMRHNVLFKARHISSKSNFICDSISRKQWARFREVAPSANKEPEPIPIQFLSLISELKLQDY